MTDREGGCDRRRPWRAVAWLLAAIIAAQLATPLAALAAAPQAAAAALLERVVTDYPPAEHTHDAAVAARIRSLSAIATDSLAPGTSAVAAARRVERSLAATRVELGPWPPPIEIRTLVAHAITAVGVTPTRFAPKPYAQITTLLETARSAGPRAPLQLVTAYAAYAARLAPRLQRVDPGLASRLSADFFLSPPARASTQAGDDLRIAQQALDDVTISRATIVADAAVIVFREGLEAVLILAAITASFTGTRAHLRRPVLLGGIAGLAATAITWVLAQALIDELGGNGLRLQAITGLLAIAVLLLVTNWFFHRIYWSQWISRFNRRRKTLEGVGFISGQVLGMVLLGLTSVYREGFETVLFLQSLQVSAGTGATLLGAGIGLTATAAVGIITFVLQRKLPYKRMLIATGILIAIVLAVMTGTTAHTFQQLGWLPTTPTSFALPIWCNRWLGLYATWETIAAQALALGFVVGSYVVAREMQASRRRRAVRSTAGAARRPVQP